MIMSCYNAFLFQKMFNLCGFFWVFISALFEFLSKVFSRTRRYNEASQSNNQIEEKTEEDEEDEVFDEKTESPTFVFKFQFETQTFQEFSNEFRGDERNHFAVGMESDPSIITPNKYEFNPGNDFSCIMENPKDSSFCVKELYADSSNGLVPEQDFLDQNLKPEAVIVEETMENQEQVEETVGFDDEGVNNGSATGSANADDSISNDLETLWEHQHLIEQLKMELKKVRATGLPTIMEESESPKMMDDLKPWKIDDKFQHVDRMSELHKFYKSYRERMRKFDILNYQKMYAIGFLQSKDPLQSISPHKSSSPPITSLLHQNLRLRRRKKSDSDTTAKFINELNGYLEMVYVGQLCLSWEILHWQYEKAIEIWETDPYGSLRFNEVAGEFQQFQVLMQRFIENEPFEGPRVQNYIKNRCVLRNLLQVPVIREDSMKDNKRRGRRKGWYDNDDDDAITSEMLVEIMEESIRIFWRFIRADKDANIVIKNSRKGTQVEPLEPADLELLAEVQTSLQKKDKKLKEIVRSGNCILRRLKKNRKDNSDQVLYFFSQVDLKLVSRVLNMSKVTKDQLLWCHNKLSKMSFVHRKINVETSFLLFPC